MPKNQTTNNQNVKRKKDPSHIVSGEGKIGPFRWGEWDRLQLCRRGGEGWGGCWRRSDTRKPWTAFDAVACKISSSSPPSLSLTRNPPLLRWPFSLNPLLCFLDLAPPKNRVSATTSRISLSLSSPPFSFLNVDIVWLWIKIIYQK